MIALAEMLAALAETFPHPEGTPARVRAYSVALSDLTPAECHVAFLVLSRQRDRRFYPSPGEILEAARPEPTTAECAELFERIEGRVIARRGYGYAEIDAEFGVAARMALAAAGGLEACWGGEGRVFALKAFTEAYREERVSPRVALGSVDERVAQLVGATVKRLGAG